MELKDLCRIAVEAGASDLHLKGGARPMVRVDGAMAPIDGVSALPPERLGKMAWDLMTPAQRLAEAHELLEDRALIGKVVVEQDL